MPYENIVDAIGHTPLVELSRISPNPRVHIYAKLEGLNPTGSLKDRIVKYMIDDAERTGALQPGQTIFEPTSGNTGISLAMVGRYKGYHVKVVMPENVSDERRQLLEAYGAEVVRSDGAEGSNGAIRKALAMMEDNPDYFMPYQYGNPMNPLAHYETTGAEILEELPQVDVFVAGLGTGGTLMGVGRRLKERNAETKVVAVVPHPGDLVQGLRSLEEGFIPPILDQTMLDGRFVVASNEAFGVTRKLMDAEGIFAGISSGSVVYAAAKLAQRMDQGNIVVLLADGGWKYLTTGLWTNADAGEAPGVDEKIWW